MTCIITILDQLCGCDFSYVDVSAVLVHCHWADHGNGSPPLQLSLHATARQESTL